MFFFSILSELALSSSFPSQDPSLKDNIDWPRKASLTIPTTVDELVS